MRLEELDEIAHLKADAVAVYQPANSQELFAVERIALAQQALLRAARLESGLFTTCLNQALDDRGNPVIVMTSEMVGGNIEITRAQNRNYLLAEGFHRLAQTANSWSLFLRYQAQAERHYRRAIEEFQRLKALRQELPNEPIFDPEPEPTEHTCPSSGTNPIPPEDPVPAPDPPAEPAKPRPAEPMPEPTVTPAPVPASVAGQAIGPLEPRIGYSRNREASSRRGNCRRGVGSLVRAQSQRTVPRVDATVGDLPRARRIP